MISLTLPYPPSANRYWRSYVPRGQQRAIVCLSDQATDYKIEVARIAYKANVRSVITGRVALGIQLYPERPQDWAKRARRNAAGWDNDVRCIDLDNALKVLIDALKGVVIDDDKWVRRIAAERMEPDAHGARVVLTVENIAVPASPQAGLYDIAPPRALVIA